MEIIKVKPKQQGGLIKKVITTYQEVFAESPWHEWKQCSICGISWGKKDQLFLEQRKYICCNKKIRDFWPSHLVMNDILELPQDVSMHVVLDHLKIVGFCWGYQISLEALEDKLNIKLYQSLLEKGFNPLKKIAYQNEIGLLNAYRGQGVARKMFVALLKDFIQQGIETLIVRTKELPEPSVTFEWLLKKLNYKILTKYPEGDGRVILVINVKELEFYC